MTWFWNWNWMTPNSDAEFERREHHSSAAPCGVSVFSEIANRRQLEFLRLRIVPNSINSRHGQIPLQNIYEKVKKHPLMRWRHRRNRTNRYWLGRRNWTQNGGASDKEQRHKNVSNLPANACDPVCLTWPPTFTQHHQCFWTMKTVNVTGYWSEKSGPKYIYRILEHAYASFETRKAHDVRYSRTSSSSTAKFYRAGKRRGLKGLSQTFWPEASVNPPPQRSAKPAVPNCVMSPHWWMQVVCTPCTALE